MSSITRTAAGACTNALIQFFFSLINRLITYVGSKELEKSRPEYKESSSTHTSSSSLLHKRKSHAYYVPNGFYKPHSGGTNILMLNRSKKNINAITQRIISAKFLKVRQLQNELIEAQKKITDLEDENRTLKNIHKRQDSALRKYESQDSHLPQLLKSHEEEIRVLTLKYKKLRSIHTDLESRYNKQHIELMNLKDRYKHLLQISQDKHLLQREHLTKQIDEMKITVNDLKNKIKLQSRRLDLEAKNYKYQLSVEFNKQKVLHEQIKHLRDTIDKLETAIRDRERYKFHDKMMNKPCPMIKTDQQKSMRLQSNRLKLIDRVPSDGEKLECLAVSIEKPDDNLARNHQHNNRSSTMSRATRINSEVVNCSENNNNDKNIVDDFESNKTGEHFKLNDVLHNFSTEHESSALETKQIQNHHCRSNNDVRQSDTKAKINNKKSDNNNNIEQVLKRIFDDTKVDNSSTDNFESHKSGQEEMSSENSDDFGPTDDTVSWLEFHEKMNNENVDSELDHFCDLFQRGITKIESKPVHQECANFNKASRNTLEKNETDPTKKSNQKPQVHNTNDHKNSVKSDRLPEDKKSALLLALEEIDCEKKNSKTSNLIIK